MEAGINFSYTSEYNGYCSGGSTSDLRNRIYKGVKYATELGMYVIIDWHILNDGNPKSHLSQAKSFFATMSKKYSKQKNVIYEICNEPNGCSWSTIRSYIRKYETQELVSGGLRRKKIMVSCIHDIFWFISE